MVLDTLFLLDNNVLNVGEKQNVPEAKINWTMNAFEFFYYYQTT